MPKLQIYAVPDVNGYQGDFVLRKRCRDITAQEIAAPWFKTFVSDMLETLYADSSGVGLAAPQVGVPIRLAVIDVKRDAKKPIVLINPTCEAQGEEKVESNETCLSVPFRSGKVMRHKSVLVHALDYHGMPIEIAGEKFLSNVLQHEIDHLDGILYIDKVEDISQLEVHAGYANAMAKKAIETFARKDSVT